MCDALDDGDEKYTHTHAEASHSFLFLFFLTILAPLAEREKKTQKDLVWNLVFLRAQFEYLGETSGWDWNCLLTLTRLQTSTEETNTVTHTQDGNK